MLAHDFAFSPYELKHLKYNSNNKNISDKIINNDIKTKITIC